MEYQSIINLLGNNPNQPTKFRAKNWVEINDDLCGTYNTNSQCEYGDAYILVSGAISVAVLATCGGNNNIQAVFKDYFPFTNCISKINNTQIDNVKNIDVAMPMYNLIEYMDNYSKISRSLWQYCRDEPTLTDAGTPDNFPGNGVSFKLKQKITVSAGDDGTKAVQMMVPLKYL